MEKHLKVLFDKYLAPIVLGFFPLVQVSMNSNWIFNPVQALPSAPFQDTWFYSGMFFYFFDYANEGLMGRHYFVERLPVNLPGYYLYHLLSPLKANYILHLGYYYVAIFSIYFILGSLVNKRSALIASLAMGSYPWFLRAVGWDYVDGAGIAYFCLSVALLVAAVKLSHWRLFLFGAGVAAACLVYTNLFWIPFVLILILFYIALNHLIRRQRLLTSGLFFVGGGLTITAFFSAFFYLATGRFFFFERSIDAAIKISNSNASDALLEGMYMPMEPYWLILPVVFLIIACFLLTFREVNLKTNAGVIQIILFVQFCLSFGFLVLWHIFFQPYLRIFLYMSYLIPSTFLLFGVLISKSLENATNRQFWIVSAASIVVFLTPLALTLSGLLYNTLSGIQDNLILLVFSSFVLIVYLLLRKRFSVVLACAAIATLGFIGGADANVYIQDRWQGRDHFVAVVEAVKAIDNIYPDNDQKLVFMYDRNDVDAPFVAIGGIYIDMAGRLIGYREDQPIGWDAITQFNDRDIILIARKGNAYKKMKAQFSRYSDTITFDLQAHVSIRSERIRFHLFLFHLNIREYDHLSPGETFEFDRPFRGKNFYSPEIIQGQSLVWSGPETDTKMYVKLGTLDQDIQLFACVGALQSEIVDSFQLYVNDVFIPTTRGSEAGCPSVFTGTIPQTAVNASPQEITTLLFRVNKTVSPIDLGINTDPRKLGLGFDWIRIE